ncbi:LLM class F420-dependent oxidoreductase [Actinomadura madurae]|uniref:LLM class F420-dependent oxidoreductase n=2 Tax=Actinomadura madurae TaxID=1993 RepID=UPI0020267E41|nr:LLM class F420-dependent oxidoreductase [Actinomadura madurae]MCP9948433.1 LLM class F420-dependent oxidoreductase [Actinomadura madurae]MCP9977699.1 LLM class F420-dependent oxidoreductase [Actinomadura madurae]MCQ0010809.1 LLM class F420-dependent oxidoreductase [Actinomadura madurae]URM94079.1 LLM class F420-dependent oxidoreductase [Actinomadura madurae]URN04786.1 LLM class F420-dependent oxidoreductase [Actinomadura madurae]
MTKINVGRLGIWRPWSLLDADLAKDVEDLGYGAIWIGGSPDGDLEIADRLLAATDRIVIATGIVNMWKTPAAEVAASYHRLNDAHGGRFLLGAGIGHPEATQEYRSPYETIVRYLDALDAADVPASGRVLAALGPKVLRLSAERAAGAHPYLTTPEHSREARRLLGDGPLLAPDQKIVLDTDPDRARALAREMLVRYLGLRNYVASFKRLGFTDADVADGGGDALVDALIAHGDAAAVSARVAGHLDAGADHVAVQALTEPGGDPRPALRAVAETLG